MTFSFKTASGDVITFHTECGGEELTRTVFEKQPQQEPSLDDGDDTN